ncbi:MAG: hypothetical protein R2695_07725 [Acidimicrobiales bacterium]
MPFWVIAFIGLATSTVSIWVAGKFTDHTLVLMAVNFAAYGVVWVGKYIVMDRLLWRHPSGDRVVTEVV